MKDSIIKFFDKHFNILNGIVVGTIIFLLIYGSSTLNVMYDDWIFYGYAENDIEQHYAGWVNYRNADWAFPLGMANNLMAPEGTIISFTDSIPLVCIFFKLFRSILPETFQFFGIYTLICFILQAISASMLICLFTKNKLHITLGSLIFVVSPIMLDRAFRHTALASHWFILFSLYLYFKSKQEGYTKFKFQYIILNSLTITIHPYFLPMVMAIMVANILQMVIKRKNFVKASLFVLLNMITTIIVGVIIGAIGTENSVGGGGFGHFSMNINAPINPISCGVNSWSVFLKPRGQILGNYDGFNYLGIGTLIIGFFCIVHCIISNNFYEFIKKICNCIKNNLGLFLICIVLTLFAISNVVTLGNNIIFEIELPDIILNLCGTFRASSRMFYTVFYVIFLSEIVYILNKFDARGIKILLVLFIVMQVVDISPALYEKNRYFSQKFVAEEYNDEIWQKIGQNIDTIYTTLDDIIFSKHLAIFSGKNNIVSNINIINRGTKTTEYYNKKERIYTEILKGNNPLGKSSAFITTINDIYIYATNNLNSELEVYESGQYKIIIPKVAVE